MGEPVTGSRSSPGGEPSSYLLARSHSVAVLGRCAVGTGTLVLGLVVAAAVTDDIPGPLAVALVTAIVIGLALTGLAAMRVLKPPVVLELSDAGYRVRMLRGAGTARQAAWTEVAKVRRQRLAPGTCLVLALNDGARTVVPLALLEGGVTTGQRLEADLRSRLDHSHGQRRLNRSDGRSGGGGI
jgi:hypothetical protein